MGGFHKYHAQYHAQGRDPLWQSRGSLKSGPTKTPGSWIPTTFLIVGFIVACPLITILILFTLLTTKELFTHQGNKKW